jgi:hypothetical protein
MIREWIRLGYLAAAYVVDGKFLSMVDGARGVSPADAVSAMASSCPLVRVFTAASSKALWR